MEKELLKLFEVAKKAADVAATGDILPNGLEVSRCMDALEQLKSFHITKNLLESTMVGKRILPLAKHPKEKIRLMASEVRKKWKTLFIRELTKEKKTAKSEPLKSSTTEAADQQHMAIKVFKIRLGSGKVLVRVF